MRLNPVVVVSLRALAAACSLSLLAPLGCAAPDDAAAASGEEEVRAERPLTTEDFHLHPRVVAVHKVVDAVEAGIAGGTIAKEERTNLCPGEFGDWFREVYTDADGAVRKLVVATMHDHVSTTDTFYYGAEGTLRFSKHEQLSIGVGAEERLLFFNDAGEVFWQVERKGALVYDDQGDEAGTDLEERPFTESEQLYAFDAIYETNPAGAFAGPLDCYVP